MKRGLDANVLVYAHIPEFAEHHRARSFLLDQLRDPKMILVLTPSVLHELVHIVTDARRFETPVSMLEAVAVARLYLGKPNIECVSSGSADLSQAFSWMERYRLGRKRLADTLFAATILRHGVTELITCNVRDFRIFESLRTIDPTASG